MAIVFYPHVGELESSGVDEKLEVLLEAAERYKAVVLDITTNQVAVAVGETRRMMPKDLTHVFNWEDIAKLLREIRDMPEGNHQSKANKAEKLARLAEIYEVLRGARMPKLEAVRIALTNEANQLRAGL